MIFEKIRLQIANFTSIRNGIQELISQRNTSLIPINVFLREIDQLHSATKVYSLLSYSSGTLHIQYIRTAKDSGKVMKEQNTFTYHMDFGELLYMNLSNPSGFLDTINSEKLPKLYMFKVDLMDIYTEEKGGREYRLPIEKTGHCNVNEVNFGYSSRKGDMDKDWATLANYLLASERNKEEYNDTDFIIKCTGKIPAGHAAKELKEVFIRLDLNWVAKTLGSIHLLHYMFMEISYVINNPKLEILESEREVGNKLMIYYAVKAIKYPQE